MPEKGFRPAQFPAEPLGDPLNLTPWVSIASSSVSSFWQSRSQASSKLFAADLNRSSGRFSRRPAHARIGMLIASHRLMKLPKNRAGRPLRV
jgi:hypothetical protein